MLTDDQVVDSLLAGKLKPDQAEALLALEPKERAMPDKSGGWNNRRSNEDRLDQMLEERKLLTSVIEDLSGPEDPDFDKLVTQLAKLDYAVCKVYSRWNENTNGRKVRFTDPETDKSRVGYKAEPEPKLNLRQMPEKHNPAQGTDAEGVKADDRPSFRLKAGKSSFVKPELLTEFVLSGKGRSVIGAGSGELIPEEPSSDGYEALHYQVLKDDQCTVGLDPDSPEGEFNRAAQFAIDKWRGAEICAEFRPAKQAPFGRFGWGIKTPALGQMPDYTPTFPVVEYDRDEYGMKLSGWSWVLPPSKMADVFPIFDEQVVRKVLDLPIEPMAACGPRKILSKEDHPEAPATIPMNGQTGWLAALARLRAGRVVSQHVG